MRFITTPKPFSNHYTAEQVNLVVSSDYSLKDIKFKQQFKQLNYYSMPNSILFVVRKRLNLLGFIAYLVYFFCKSFI